MENKFYTANASENTILEYPFFDRSGTDVLTQSDSESSELLKSLTDKYNLPEKLVDLYKCVDDKTEIIYPTNENDSNVIFFSLKQVGEFNEKYTNEKTINGKQVLGQNDWVDIGLKYCGLGNVYVFSWSKSLQKVFIRIDGGSNGYDRQYNYEFFMNPNEFKPNECKIELYSIEYILENLKNKEIYENAFIYHGPID